MINHAKQKAPVAFDDTGGGGSLVVLLPGAGDLRSEYRFITGRIAEAGHRVVTADLPGHGDSSPCDTYTVASTADAVTDLVRLLDGGPATVVATSFAPAAAVWMAAEHPELVAGIVVISPHLHADHSLKGRLLAALIKVLLAGPWAPAAWARIYPTWYKDSPPDDLDAEIDRMRAQLADPSRRRAVRHTLTAGREGVEERISRVGVPTLTVFGSADDHFADPLSEAARIAKQLGGEHLVVEGAGHYPHVEQPAVVADAILRFLDRAG